MLDFSAFRPKVISEFKSLYSGQIQVKQDGASRYVSVGNLTQSWGIVKEVWQPVIKRYGKKGKHWLILGLAAGTVARLIPQPAQITGVEIDPVMLKIGRQYFDLDKIPNLKILNKDAHSWLLTTNSYFDYILVDLYLGDQCPAFVYSPKFLKRLKIVGKTIFINHLFYDDAKRHQAGELVRKLKAIFENIRLHRVLTNLMIICS